MSHAWRGRILLVDDDDRNLRLLRRILEVEGYETTSANHGELGLELLHHERPDLVLLDVMMPGLDGHTVCRRIKAHPDTASTPVLFVTALHDDAQQVQCLDVGGDDFVTKPVDPAVLLARVRTHLRIKHLHDRVAQSRDELRGKNQRLEALERMRDDLMHMLVHDLKSPIAALDLSLQLLDERHADAGDADRPTLDNLRDCAIRLEMIVRNILDVAKIEEAKLTPRLAPTSLHRLLDDSLRPVRVLAAHDQQRVVTHLADDLPWFPLDADLIGRVLENLVSNALKSSDEGDVIEVAVCLDPDGRLLVTVKDRGPGIPDELRCAIFEKFRGADDRQRSSNHGLGLTFCKLAVEAHGGAITVRPRDGGGSVFEFHLPALVEPRETGLRALQTEPILA